jgi:hypothetical protein
MPATINRPAPGSGSIVQPAAPLGMLASGGLAGQSVRWTARPFPAVASPATSDRIFAQLGRRHGPQSAAAADGWEDLDDWLEIDAGEGETSGRILTV